MNQAAVKIDKRKLAHSDTILVIIQTPAITPVTTTDITKSIDSVTKRLKEPLVVKNTDSSFFKDFLPAFFASLVAALVGAVSAFYLQNKANQLNICYHKIDSLTNYLYKHDEYLKKCMESEGSDASNIDNLLKSDEYKIAQVNAKFLDQYFDNKGFSKNLDSLKEALEKVKTTSDTYRRLWESKRFNETRGQLFDGHVVPKISLEKPKEELAASYSVAEKTLDNLLDSLAFNKSIFSFVKKS